MNDKSLTFRVPNNIGVDYDSLSFLVEVSESFETHHELKFVFDFCDCRWLRANLTAVLGAVFLHGSEELGHEINFINLSPSIKRVLQKNHFLKRFGLGEVEDVFRSTIKYKEFSALHKNKFSEYIRSEFIPSIISLAEKFNEDYKKEFRLVIEELFQNARLHGNCSTIFTCGQYFHGERKVFLTLVNRGTTIKKNIDNKYPDKGLNDSEAIEWATQKGNSTRIDAETGGLGLALLIKFLHANQGSCQIISGAGFWESDKKTTSKLLGKRFSGTIVNLVFSLPAGYHAQERVKVKKQVKNIF